MKLVLEFEVLGKAQTAGSKNAVPFDKGFAKHGKRQLGVRVFDNNPQSKEWKESVGLMGRLAMKRNNVEMIVGYPLAVMFEFIVARPAKHYRTGKYSTELRSDAPLYPAVAPDVLKLARAAEDGMNKIVYADDSLIVDEVLTKSFGPSPGVTIRIYALPRTKAEERLWPTINRLPFQF
jgi:Holliday junction resolvase RusA-like endonuclease